jgi:hypothetical protein
MAGNKVFINQDGLIEIVVAGDQTFESVQAMGEKVLEIARQLHADGKPALLLDNLLLVGQVPTEARQLVVTLVKSSDYDKLAMVGKGTAMRLGANLMLQATGRGKKVKYFDDRAKAEYWLQH